MLIRARERVACLPATDAAHHPGEVASRLSTAGEKTTRRLKFGGGGGVITPLECTAPSRRLVLFHLTYDIGLNSCSLTGL